jgi:sugar O-acyltransferase (sialic acid O-acetyltransferase NeuD family)
VLDVVIIGVGGLGRECSEWIEHINAERPTFRLLGFLDDDANKHGAVVHDLEVLGNADWLASQTNVAAIIGIGNPAAKRRMVERLVPYVTRFPVLHHPDAVVGRHVRIGDGTIICPGVIATTDIRIGKFVTLNFDLTIGHDCQLGDYVTLAPGVHLSGYSKIGEGADLGAGVVTIPGVDVGAWTIVGAGASVTKSLPQHCTAVGVPARVIKQRSES